MQTTADIVIRGLRDDDFDVLARIRSAVYPDSPTSAGEFRHFVREVVPAGFEQDWLIAEDQASERVVGYAWYHQIAWSYHPHKYFLRGAVHPDWQGKGIGRGLMDAVLSSLGSRGAQRVKTNAREDDRRAVAFLERYGFTEHARSFESRLAIQQFDLRRFARYAERPADYGVTITTLQDELRRNPHCLGAVYQAHCALDIGAPRDDPELPTPPPYEHFLANEIHHSQALHDAFFLAKVRDFYIGESALRRSEADPTVLYQQLTGVGPEYRGRGIAMALKLKTVAYAQRHGYREIRTWNSSKNRPMLAINDKLGFVRQPAWIEFQVTL